MDVPILNLQDLNRFLQLTKKRGADVLSTIGRLNKYIENVLNTEVGQSIMQEDLARITELFPKVYQEKASVDEIAEFRYLRDVRIPSIAKKVKVYLESLEKVKNVSNL
jgi:uncharacterized protein YnzC (UPF0291/DUF896 family)